jgi:dihydrofolate reductase
MGSAGGARALSRRAHLTAEFRGGPPTSKVVFSSTLEPPLSWVDTELVRGDAVEVVREMKRRDSRPMRTVGSLSLCRSLFAAGLVDRFRVVVFPVITGATGTDRIFDGCPDIALDLVDSRLFDASSSSNTCPECSTDRPAPAARPTRLGGGAPARSDVFTGVRQDRRLDDVPAGTSDAARCAICSVQSGHDGRPSATATR